MALGCLLRLALNHRLHLTKLLSQIKPYMYMYVHASEIVGRAASRESKWEGGMEEGGRKGKNLLKVKDMFMYRYRMKERRNCGL